MPPTTPAQNTPIQHTLAMTVANTGFMLDRLGQDCGPLQFLRELTQNGLEAILALPGQDGSIVWDIDWNTCDLTSRYKLSITDNGIGMTGPEMIKYINKLSSSGREQSYDGNYGVGAKIAAATRNHSGLIYLSWKDSHGAMVHLWRDPSTGTYGLKQFEWPDGSFNHWAPITDELKPSSIDEHGTVVILLGNDEDANTMQAPAQASSPSRWVTYYLNTRYFRFPDGIEVTAREGWEHPRTNTDSNVLRTLTGQGEYLSRHASDAGYTQLTGAKAHWWILREEGALTQNSGFVASNGHVAALYQDELYELVTGRGGTARLQNFGVIFGSNRVVLYVEPDSSPDETLTSNTARTRLLIDGLPLPWADWAAEFRVNLPAAIKALMEEVTAGATSSDHRQAIRERLRQIRDLFRLSRYRPTRNGAVQVDPGDFIVGAGKRRVQTEDTGRRGGRSGGSGGDPGNIYALFIAAEGTAAEAVSGDADPIVDWVSVEDGTRTPPDLDDRAGKYLYDQNRLIINGDFRVFTDFVNRWVDRYQVAGSQDVIRETVREWFEQALIETVVGTLALRGSREWSQDDMATSLSEEALTAAVMPRSHIEMAVKRALGSRLGALRERVS